MDDPHFEYQDQQMGRLFPQFRREYITPPGEALWRGTIRPLPESRLYNVAVWYRVGEPPKVWVREVVLAGSCKRAPHLYNDDSLCLFYPKDWRWQDTELIADTTLYWASHWLIFYGMWVDSDKWWGPEAPHSQRSLLALPKRGTR